MHVTALSRQLHGRALTGMLPVSRAPLRAWNQHGYANRCGSGFFNSQILKYRATIDNYFKYFSFEN